MRPIELLGKQHDRDRFDCGRHEAFNQFLKQAARQHIQKGVSRTFGLVDTEQPESVIGFFTLTMQKLTTLVMASSTWKIDL